MTDSDTPSDVDSGPRDPESTGAADREQPAEGSPPSKESGDGSAEPDTTKAPDASNTRNAPDAATDPPAALLTDRRSLDTRVRRKWVARSLVLGAVVGVGVGATVAGVVSGSTSAPDIGSGVLAGVAAFVLAGALGVGHAVLLFRSWEYEVRTDALYLQRGVVTHVSTIVPFVRVQHIDTSRGPIERALGLSSLVVYTAGSRGADVTIPGLTPAEADDLQDRLKTLAQTATGEDAV